MDVCPWCNAVVIPDGPPAAPFLADRTFLQNTFSLKSNTGSLGGDTGIDIKVLSFNNPNMMVWVNACANEVQNCRMSADSNAVIGKDIPDNTSPDGQGRLAPAQKRLH